MLRLLAIGVVVAEVGYLVWNVMQEPSPPYLDPNPWWGPGRHGPEDTSIKPFKINISQEELDDMQTRLQLPLRLTPALEGVNFTYGFNDVTLDAVVKYWLTKYDWRKREARLNSYPHFKTKIEGLDIHFLRASAKAGPGVTVVPLLMVHGWPGTVVELFNTLPLLTTEQDGSGVAFEVICPSIPGYGFSQASSKQGLGILETAQIFLKLMKRLGYDQFYTQGGDWGSTIVSAMATLYPDNVLAVHLNAQWANTVGTKLKMLLGSVLPTGLLVAQEDQHKLYPLSRSISMLLQETGYMHLQTTKPDTIGAALNQHPASLAAYIMEKFSSFTNTDNPNLPDGGLLQNDFPIHIDEMLDVVCFYWFTGSITSSMRFYAETLGTSFTRVETIDKIPCRVPAGLAAFPNEFFLLNQPKNFMAHKYYDIVSYRNQPAGGHFAAMERPQLLAADVHSFVKEVRRRQ